VIIFVSENITILQDISYRKLTIPYGKLTIPYRKLNPRESFLSFYHFATAI